VLTAPALEAPAAWPAAWPVAAQVAVRQLRVEGPPAVLAWPQVGEAAAADSQAAARRWCGGDRKSDGTGW
jgi:hypothetical protein